MSRPAFLFRPDLRKDDHRQAWEMLDAQPSGFKNEFLAQAILCAKRQETLETMLRRVLIEQFGNMAQVNTIAPLANKNHLQMQQNDENGIPKFMMDFLGELEL
ncbi:MAG: plasmid segregation centromere-binding protein ParR [Anaerovoracaceae bacterium]